MSEAPTYEISFMLRRILVPFDGSSLSLKALNIAVDLARHYGSQLTVLYVKVPGETGDPLDLARSAVGKKITNVRYKTIELKENESISSIILKEAVEESYDLIVVGARGKTSYFDLSIGSIPLALAVNSTSSVLIVR
ncbi:universal stress protein [Thermogladius sp. KZ2Tp1]|uniref:universal stress protein n=1 Tax=unclassified Thermogladius TaxID=2647734 RepID=UPI003D09B0C1